MTTTPPPTTPEPKPPLPQASGPPEGSPGWAPPPSPRRGGRRYRILLIAVVVVVALAVIIASHITLNYYAIQPGTAQPVAPLIKVPPSKAHQLKGEVLLTDVELGQVTALNYIPYLLSSNTDLVPSGNVLGPDTSAAELTTQGYLEMAQSQAAAKSLALTTLGYHVPARNAGALLFAVAPGSPASSAVQVGQIIVGVNGTSTPTSCDFVSAVHDIPAGTTVQLRVEQSTVTPNAVIRSGPVVTPHVRLGKPPAGEQSSGCPGVTGPSKGYLGVSIDTQVDYTYPFPISVNTTDIGGPSAGLAMTLGIIDKLSSGDVTGHHKVAATGTIDTQGQVGDVSGVPQKTVAVENAGATVFMVPPQELAAAKSKDIPSLHVYAVSSLSQALAVLRHIGGTIPKATTSRAEDRTNDQSG